jgi:hypothetical protein
MVMLSKLMTVSVMMIFLISCQSETNRFSVPDENQTIETPNPTPEPEPIETPLPTPTPSATYSRPGPSNFKAVIIDGEKPNEYSVKITWDWSKSYRGKFKITRKNMSSNEEGAVELIELDSSEREYLDAKGLKNGVKYNYSISVENENDSVGEYEVFIPTDLVISKNSSLLLSGAVLRNKTYYLSAHRVFLMDELEIVLDGNNIEINADIISFDSIHVHAFDKNETKTSWFPSVKRHYGRNGSNVSIIAEEYRKPISKIEDDHFIPQLIIDVSGEKGKNGSKGRNGIIGGVRDCANYRYHDGGDGEDGKDGGNGGNVFVKIKKYNYQLLPVVKSKTNGGQMGIGGDGGDKGNGIMARSWECPNFHKPIPGQRGKDGRDGKAGTAMIVVGDHLISEQI